MNKQAEQKEAKKELLTALRNKEDVNSVQAKVDIFNKAFGTKVSLGNMGQQGNGGGGGGKP